MRRLTITVHRALMVEGTYRVRYLSGEGTHREFIGQFQGLEADPLVPDHVAFFFILTTNRIEDITTGQTLTIDAPDPSAPMHFHLWQEDLIDVYTLTRGQEPTA